MSLRGNFLVACVLLCCWHGDAATHDELPQCGLTGVYKTRQSVLESPNYPNNYPTSTCWDYVVRSPYRCPTKFHIQFLDFMLESSVNCTRDYLAIGLENVDDDMDVLCGQVIGIKKYHTPDGILRLRFLSDDSPWTTAKGFKLLVTRLACEREEQLVDNLGPTDEQIELQAPPLELQPPLPTVPALFRNFSAQEQHHILPLPPLFGAPQRPQAFYVPTQPTQPTQPPLHVPSPPLQTPHIEKPCVPTVPSQQYLLVPTVPNQQQLPQLTEQYPSTSWRTYNNYRSNGFGTQFNAGLQTCCATPFSQKRFYLSSPGFPQSAFSALLPTQQRDCLFQLQKSSASVCRLHILFRYFAFGQAYSGNGVPQGIHSTRDVCTEDYLELDGQRFCGCRTGYVHVSFWGENSPKFVRMRMGYSGLPSAGFLLDLIQEECHPIEQQQPAFQQHNRPFQSFGTNNFITPQIPSVTIPQTYYLPTTSTQQQQQQQQQQPQIWQSQRPPYYQAQFNNYPFQYNANLPASQQFLTLLPELRQARAILYAKAANTHQPHSVVETNSTRKEFYFYDGDEAFEQAQLQNEPDDPERVFSVDSQRCHFDVNDARRLSGDPLWITKPICYAPQRSLFGSSSLG